MSSPYQSSFFVIPARIMNLPDLVLSYLRIYETIFQFWNHGKNCYLSNAAIMERTGISSESTLREAFMYFENKGELIRRKKGGKRYFIQPERMIEIDDNPVDKSKHDSIKSVQTVAKSTEYRRQVDAPTVAKSTHNNKKINNKNIREREPLSNFEPNEENQLLAKDLKLNLIDELDSFCNRHKGEKTQYEFGRWLKSAHQYLNKKSSSVSNEIRSTVPEYGPGHPRWEQLHGNQTNGSKVRSDNTGRDGVRKVEGYLF